MQLVRPGEALITDTNSAASVSFFGELICTYLQRKGVEAVVTDAGICDIFDVAATGLPVFTSSGSVASDGSMVVCEHSCPINFCGVAVYPGDVLVGDKNGVVVVPRNMAAEVAKKAVRSVCFLAYRSLCMLTASAQYGRSVLKPTAVGGSSILNIPTLLHDAVHVQREKEDMERYLVKKLADGAELDGTYPPSQAQIAEYDAYRASL